MTLARRLAPLLLTAVTVTSAAVLVEASSTSPAAAAPPAAVAVAVAPASGPVQVRVVQYNIRYGSRGLPAVARDIRRTRAQVVLLNEVDDRRRTGGVHQARWLARRLGMRAVYDASSRAPLGVRGNPVLTRHGIGRVQRFDLHQPAGTRPRGLMRVRVHTRGVSLDVWTMHLHPGRGTVRQARQVAARVGVPRCATVVGGDLNAGPGSREDRALRTHLHDAWRATQRRPGPTNFQGTERIDYLYVRHVAPVATRVTPLRASDHRAVVGVLRVPRWRSC